ncbi:MAG TPA: hypothetical protein VJL88_10835 [Nitrospira sp.]|nr:hypothetical protein [Nitrospira sp.]
MASTPLDPQVGHSLWLQRRSRRRVIRRRQWRSDWAPIGLLFVLLGLLLLLSLLLPSNDAVEKVRQAAEQDKGDLQPPPVVGVLTKP